MDAKVCDRCGSIYPNKIDSFYEYSIVRNQTFDRRARNMDLCDKCSQELDMFMRKEQKKTDLQEFYDPVTGQIVVRGGR